MIDIEIEHGSTNVYEDLGLPNAAEMHVKAILAAKIGEIIKHRISLKSKPLKFLACPSQNFRACYVGSF